MGADIRSADEEEGSRPGKVLLSSLSTLRVASVRSAMVPYSNVDIPATLEIRRS
jgi:hypothetical protein